MALMNSIIDLMHDEIHRSYSVLIKRFARHPKSLLQDIIFPSCLPFLIGQFPSILKCHSEMSPLMEACNFHGILLAPPVSKFKGCLVTHFGKKQWGYLKKNLARLDAKEITYKPDYVVGYGMKSLKRRAVDFDDVLILPKCVNELPGQRS